MASLIPGGGTYVKTAPVPMNTYKPYRYQVKGLATPYTDPGHQERTNVTYQMASIIHDPQALYDLYQKIAGQDGNFEDKDEDGGISNKDIEAAFSNGLYQQVLQSDAGGLIMNEECPADALATVYADFRTVFKFLTLVKDSLAAQGKGLSDVMVQIEEQFFGTDMRRTERVRTEVDPLAAQKLLDPRYSNHHLITRATVIPKDKTYGTVMFMGMDPTKPMVAAASIPVPTSAADGTVTNNNFDDYNSNVRKKVTVTNPVHELTILRQIAQLAGGDLRSADLSSKRAELMALVNQLESKFLVNNHASGDLKTLQFDLFVELNVLLGVEKSGQLPLVWVDLFENVQGINNVHVINAAMAYEAKGYLGVGQPYIAGLEEKNEPISYEDWQRGRK